MYTKLFILVWFRKAIIYMSPQIAYFFKRIYGNIIKWWFVIYNPIARRIWPSKQEEEIALAKEAEEEAKEKEIENAEREELTSPLEYSEPDYSNQGYEEASSLSAPEPAPTPVASNIDINDCNYNATTGSFSGLYGTGPVDSGTQSMFDEIMGRNNAAHSVDISAITIDGKPLTQEEPAPATPADQDEVMAQANEIYERLMREAAADEAAKQAEIEAAKAAQG